MDETERTPPPGGASWQTGLQRLRAWLRGDGSPSGLPALLGIVPIAAEAGLVVFTASPVREHYNTSFVVHGGFTATLLDTAMGYAAQTVVPAGQRVTTLELKISYHRAITAETGRIEATGRVLSHGRRTVFSEGQVRDAGGRLLASGTSTLLILPDDTSAERPQEMTL